MLVLALSLAETGTCCNAEIGPGRSKEIASDEPKNTSYLFPGGFIRWRKKHCGEIILPVLNTCSCAWKYAFVNISIMCNKNAFVRVLMVLMSSVFDAGESDPKIL